MSGNASNRAQLQLAFAFTGFLLVIGALAWLPIEVNFGGKLRGVVTDTPAPEWDWESLRSGRAFRAAEAWYDEHVGLRDFWIRLDGEVTYALFGEAIEHKVGTNVVVGEHDWLFERHYIKNAITPGRMDPARVRRAIQHMKSVQDKLAKRGIPFILVVAPNKASLYPEHVPAAQFGRRHPDRVTTSYERFRPEFIAAGINLYDSPTIFQDWKNTGQRYLFARSGTHWSYNASVRVLQDLRERLNPHMRRPLPPFVIEKTTMEPAQGTDMDLLNLLNLLTTWPYNHPHPFPKLQAQKDVPVENLPRILWVHDSFGWPLIEMLYHANAAQPTESLYYFENAYLNPGGTLTKTKVKAIQWEPYLKDCDAVVMVWTEIAFDFLGWNFCETLDAQLK